MTSGDENDFMEDSSSESETESSFDDDDSSSGDSFKVCTDVIVRYWPRAQSLGVVDQIRGVRGAESGTAIGVHIAQYHPCTQYCKYSTKPAVPEQQAATAHTARLTPAVNLLNFGALP